MDRISPQQRSKIMRAIHSTNTKDEVRLAKALWHLGYYYRKNNKTIFGKPDLTFKKHKIAVFVDGEFFHGKDWDNAKNRFKSNQEFWCRKIERNMERDKEVNQYLLSIDWIVLRFWSKEIQNKLDECIEKIVAEINKRSDLHY